MRSFVLLAAALGACCTPTAVGSQPAPADPVSFEECRPVGDREFSPHNVRLIVKLRNDSGRTLTSVRIAMLVHGAVETTIEDGETLAPGASINPWLAVDTGALPLEGRTTCAIAAVRYADGTTWTNPVLGANADIRVAQTQGSPVRIERCFTNQAGVYPSAGGSVWTRFVNEGPIAATRVAYSLVVAGERVMRFENTGTFAPGATASKDIAADGNIFPVGDVHPQCRIDAVYFGDGTSWTNPEARFEPYGTFQTPGARIDVLHCAMYLPNDTTSNGIYFGFRNAAAETATEVDFAFWARGKRLETGTFKGTYSTGAKVDFGVGLGYRTFPLGTTIVDCRVTRVVYADGTIWNAEGSRSP
jgi:hypothetical protein